MMKNLALLFMFIWMMLPQIVLANKPLTDGDIRNYIVSGSISNYPEVCPCPFSTSQGADKQMHECGDQSAYIQNPESVKCYPGDVTDQEVRQYRRDNGIDEPMLPWDKDKKPGY